MSNVIGILLRDAGGKREMPSLSSLESRIDGVVKWAYGRGLAVSFMA